MYENFYRTVIDNNVWGLTFLYVQKDRVYTLFHAGVIFGDDRLGHVNTVPKGFR